MPKCRNCVHWEACREYVIGLAAARGVDLDATELEQIFDSDDCDHFHGSSRFVELPCKVGDSYFEIEQYCTERGFYKEPQQTDIMDCEYCDVDGVCDRQYRITEKRFVSLIQIFEYKEKAAGRYNRKFLTKGEAEQALKERESNAGQNDT